MEINWPDGLAELGEFLKTQGLSFQRRGIVPHTHDILWQYGNDRIAVRVIADRGDVWSAQVADIAGWPQEWYDATALRELITGSMEDGQSVSEKMRIIKDNWLAIVQSFAEQNREKTHSRLKKIRAEWAKREFGN